MDNISDNTSNEISEITFDDTLDYELKLSSTELATGFFTALPCSQLSLDEAVALLHHRPMDKFLHQYALNLMAKLDTDEVESIITRAKAEDNMILQALTCEQLLLSQPLPKVEQFFSRAAITEMGCYTPLVDIPSALMANRRLHTGWIKIFRENMTNHTPLPSPDRTGLPPICHGECMVRQEQTVTIVDMISTMIKSKKDEKPLESGQQFSLEQTAQTALERLNGAGVKIEQEMRHESSLSPFALLRRWSFSTWTDNLRNRFTLSGPQTSYGRGLTLEHARASLSMEIVERCSAFASISQRGVEGYARDYPLTRATHQELLERGISALNPADLALEVNYSGEPLHWIEGMTPGKNGLEPAMVPVQALFLFCNLDETSLFSGLGSTGLASGNTMEQAKLSAVLEIVERHQEATVPFTPETCFDLVTKNSPIASLFEAYRAMGIHLQFQDLTPKSGIPCCKCFVRAKDGTIHKGTATRLNARQAIVSAMTETTYPFPSGPPSAGGLADLVGVRYNNLPDYSTGDHGQDLDLVEKLLMANGRRPFYVDLTRRDIGLPVVKALIPGMDILGDFDRFSRVHPELFQNYLERFSQ